MMTNIKKGLLTITLFCIAYLSYLKNSVSQESGMSV